MSKEINIDEILTRSKKQAEEREQKKTGKPTVTIDEETGEATEEQAGSSEQGQNPFDSLGAMFGGNATGNAFSSIDPKIVEMMTNGQVPGYKNLPLKQRIMFRVMRIFGTPKGKNFLKKRWWPVWAVVLLLLFAVLLVIGVFYAAFRLVTFILGPYIDIFRPKK